ncbi:MAG TPA: heat-inducible transcriptional repressor HrcA [Bryobacteraceae bacterium]|nr:heat-inducible transcriptional repressor HrcA [Bryobacteraceae bacterium]
MTPRDLDILHAVVQSYIETGEPVASRTISRRRKDGLSAATVRNVMADLAEGGFLSQPHTSAGRVPTERAFRSYVHSLVRARLLVAELQRLRAELSKTETMEERVEHSSHILTEMTRGVGIAAAIPTASQTLDHIELISLADRRVLMVVVTSDRIVRNRVVTLDDMIPAEEMASIRNYINRNFSGWSLPEVHAELKRRLEQQSATYDAVLRRLTVLYTKGLLSIDSSPEVHLEGASNLIGLDFHLTREKMRELFRALEEKKRIVQLLDRFLEQPSGEVAVQVGLAEAHPSMRELSLIGVTIALQGGMAAKIAVLGPMRMNYEKAISAVLHMGQAFQSIPA